MLKIERNNEGVALLDTFKRRLVFALDVSFGLLALFSIWTYLLPLNFLWWVTTGENLSKKF